MNYLKVFKSTYYQILARILSSGSGFLISIILAKSFGIVSYGNFIEITSYIALFYLFCDFGINAIFLQNENKEESFRHLFYLRLVIATVVFLAANLLVFILPYNNFLQTGFSAFVKFGIFIFSLELFIQAILYSVSAVFQEKFRYDFWAKAQALGAFSSLLLVSLAAISSLSLYYVLAALIVSDVAIALLSLFYAKVKIFPPSLDIKIAAGLFKQSFPIGMMLIFNLVYFRIDSIILASYHNSQAVGIYAISYQLFDFLLAIPLFISNSIYPILIKEKGNKELFLKLTRSYAFVYLVISFLLIFAFWFLSPLLLLISKDFSKSIELFRILLLGLPFFFLTSLYQWVLIALKRTNFLMTVYFLLMCTNIALNFIYIPKYSYFAAAWITVLGEAFVFMLFFVRILVQRYGRN